MDFDKLVSDLENPNGGEGFKPLLYDDGTGKPIVQGSTVHGFPTIGIGWNVSATPLSLPRARIVLGWQLGDVADVLHEREPWVLELSDARQRAMVELSFALGEGGLEQFGTFLALMRAGDFNAAATDLANTKWAVQVGHRCVRICQQIRTG
jgi:lysozyme